MDVAFFAVHFLNKYFKEPDSFEGKWGVQARGFRYVVERKLGYSVTPERTRPGSLQAKEMERALRRFIAEDAEFGAQLWLTLSERLEYSIYLAHREVLYDADLLERNEVYIAPDLNWNALVVALLVCGVLCGVFSFTSFLK